MYYVQDAVGHDKNIHYLHNVWWALFFVFHFFLCNLLVLNTFVGVLIEKYIDVKNEKSINL